MISLFTGAGGLDYGFEAAGFRTAIAVEMDADCCRTLKANRKDWPLMENDLTKVSTDKILEKAGLEKGQAALVIGGPPCQPFSKAGYWKRQDTLRLADPRANTLEHFLRVVEEAQPQAVLLENVVGLGYRGKDEGLQMLLKEFERINHRTGSNYIPKYKILNAADFGVPQIRERLFVIAARDGRAFTFPSPTHASSPPPDSALEKYRTAWDAIGDLKNDTSPELKVKGKWADLLPSVPEGSNYLHHTPEGEGEPLFGWRCRYWSFLLKLSKQLPSWTIPAQPGPASGPFHWKNRRLSMRELCRLQTFPNEVNILGSINTIQRQVGNAVPSLLAEVLARAIRTQLLDLPDIEHPPRLRLSQRFDVPRKERARKVPAAYYKYKGKHEAHPGEGKGPGARALSGTNSDHPTI
ncbi:MAG TPA: DNA cytosine methyltransferase [Archangium sp.]|uniref:DNA cytosine methyltransferase n=1 Tax=Archangium sp. TaxID=1872627 RepID=UPI002E3231D5|nr:DNA cytosine methyltransferase [Archangium sp.]HEX5750059.1 DNA cytosine methyltransferase [Archangium sp.]